MFKKLWIGMLVMTLVLGFSITALTKGTVTYWDTNPPTEIGVRNYERFLVEFPDIKIEREYIPSSSIREKVMIAIAGDTTPDVVFDYIGRVFAYYYQDVLESLNGTLLQSDDFFPSLLEQFTINETLIGYPGLFGCRLWGIDKIAVEKAGVANLLPQGLNREWSFEDFMEVAEAVKEIGIFPFGFFTGSTGGDYLLIMYTQIFGAKLYEDGDLTKTTWNSEEGVRALEWMVEMIEEGYAPPGAAGLSPGNIIDMKAAGKVLVGSLFSPTSNQAHYDSGIIDYVKNDWQIEVPHIKGVPAPPIFDGPAAFSLFKSVKDRDAALTFMNFMVSKESAENLNLNTKGWIPISSRLSAEVLPGADVTRFIINKNGIGELGLISPYYNEIRVIMAAELQAAFMGVKSPKEALDDFAQEVSKLWE